MKYVLDSSVAFKLVVAETNSDTALQLRDEFALAKHDLLAPDVFPYEVAHALTRAERQKRIAVGQALHLWLGVMALPPRLVPGLPLTDRAVAISSTVRIGVYDCLYVALAEREGCELITADGKLIRNLQAAFPFITPLAALP